MGKQIENQSTNLGPSFLGVGPEKTGTTWIDRQLRQHHDVWLPPIKELRYFWEREKFPSETFFDRVKTKESWHRVQYARYARYRLKNLILHPANSFFADFDRLVWDFRYIISIHDDQWYLSCFQNHDDTVSGEISPQYFNLPLNQIKHIHNLLPDCKIIISLRKPIDWVWSFAKMLSENGDLKKKYKDLDEFIDTMIATFSFSKALSNWIRIFGKHQILILFYENLKKNPWVYYTNICDFLEIIPDKDLKSTVSRRVNIGKKQPLPNKFVSKIKKGWEKDIQALPKIVPNVPASWFD